MSQATEGEKTMTTAQQTMRRNNPARTSCDGPYRKGIADGYQRADELLAEQEHPTVELADWDNWDENLINAVGRDETRRYLCGTDSRTLDRYNRGCNAGWNRRMAEVSR